MPALLGLLIVLSAWHLAAEIQQSTRVSPKQSLLGERLALCALYCDILPAPVADLMLGYARLKERNLSCQAVLQEEGLKAEELETLPQNYRLIADYRDSPSAEKLAYLRGTAYASLYRLLLCWTPPVLLTMLAILTVSMSQPSNRPSSTALHSTSPGIVAPLASLCLWVLCGDSVAIGVVEALGLSHRESRIVVAGMASYTVIALALVAIAPDRSRLAPGPIDWVSASRGYLLALLSVNLCEAVLEFAGGFDIEGRLLAQNSLSGVDWVFLLSLSVLAVLLGPYLEELLFRGFLLSAWARRARGEKRKRYAAVLLSSLLFALCHGNVWAVPGLFIFSLVVSYVYLQTKSVSTAFTVHAAWNLTSLCLILSAS